MNSMLRTVILVLVILLLLGTLPAWPYTPDGAIIQAAAWGSFW